MDPLLLLFIGIAVVFGGIIGLRLHPFLALVLGALIVSGLTQDDGIRKFGSSKKMSSTETEKIVNQTIGQRVANAFGGTAAKVGILIALASVIGKCLLESGGADRIVRSFLGGFGEARAGLAFLCSGFVLGIPVFFDTVFFLAIPLAKSLRMRTGKHYSLYILAIIAGASISHSLVPPTPGPLFVARELGVEMGEMIIAGLMVGAICSMAGYLYAVWYDRKFDLPLRETEPGQLDALKILSTKDEKELPSFFMSMLPIVLPVIFITSQTFINSPAGVRYFADFPPSLLNLLKSVGDPIMALGISTVLSLGLVIQQKRRDLEKAMAGVPSALKEAGTIILITSAGGAFGGILQQTGIGPRIQEISGDVGIGVLPLVWLVTALVRVAQGSATVAMITAVGMVAGLATKDQLGFNPVWVAVAIGCGSKMLPWMNDSGFWVVCKMSGFTEKETLQTFTPLLSIMGIVGLIATMICARMFPML